jgi:hypothetical protein
MNKTKTAELTGAALDWVVAKCEGKNPSLFLMAKGQSSHHYSTDWAQGGPIVEREAISLKQWHGAWTAELEYLPDDDANYRYGKGGGTTPLIAAMRCYVASKLGDTVDIPAELLTN